MNYDNCDCGGKMIEVGKYRPEGSPGCPPRAERTIWRCDKCDKIEESFPRRNK